MFVIDAFIGNNDRNNGNWGILVNIWPDIFPHELPGPQLAPVYDNCHKINPFEFIKNGSHQDCTAAGFRFINAVDMTKIESIINDIPEQVKTLAVMPKIQKVFYVELLKARFDLIKNALNK